ncbi:MAG: hypothetical protein JW829_05350 [Pirellulales bacterium]|nr:hypothetical protein [Pirellulales bacterium]
MVRTLFLAVFITHLMLATQASLACDCLCCFKQGCLQNLCWPKPYIYPDRAAVAAPFALMIDNGWRRNNLLGDHHFTPDGSKLTTAGELKIRWILTQAPENRRSIFVQKTWVEETDTMRLEAVQLAASSVLPIGAIADVQPTHLQVEGQSADLVDRINTRFRESLPPPILPAATSNAPEE